jgi:hypothetical protein
MDFKFLLFEQEFLKGLQSPEALTAQISLINTTFGGRQA